MPIRVQNDLPVKEILEQENIFVMDEHRAMHQDIRPIKIGLLNLMPLKEAANAAQSARFDALEARMSVMTPEEREAFAAKAAEIAARPAAQPVQEQPQAEDSQEPSEQAEASAEQ